MAYDGLTDSFEGIAMGESTEKHNTRLGIARPEQDEIAALSHQRAAAAQKNGIYEAEITPVEIPQRKGDPVLFSKDEASAATPPPSPWASCVRPSPRTARSPPAPPRRSPTAPPPWS